MSDVFNCTFCNKQIKTKSSITCHERRCNLNPNRTERKKRTNKGRKSANYPLVNCCKCNKQFATNAIKKHEDACDVTRIFSWNISKHLNCDFCDKIYSTAGARKRHQHLCNHNPNKVKPKGNNQFIKARNLGKVYVMSEEHRLATKKGLLNSEKNKNKWSPERRAKLSESMRKAVIENPQSYNAANVNGRVKSFYVKDSFGKETRLSGKWELDVSQELNNLGVKWQSVTVGFPYQWNGSTHQYFPDFFLPDFDCYIEVKGYQRDRDLCKWDAFPSKLVVLKLKEINLLRKGRLDLLSLL